ncbi:MAG: hypothetical protein Q7R75_02320 [bacterium]|nr:hypothetical protein [bacterium]
MESISALPGPLSRLLNYVLSELINPALYLLLAIAVIIFIYGIIEMIAGAANDKKREEGRQHLMWGIIGLFIMLGVWGIISIIKDSIALF